MQATITTTMNFGNLVGTRQKDSGEFEALIERVFRSLENTVFDEDPSDFEKIELYLREVGFIKMTRQGVTLTMIRE